MSLFTASIEYLLMVTIFESIRRSDEKELNKKALDKERNNEILSMWNPLSEKEWKHIKNLNN